jgi:hypothetical protein
MTDSFLAILGRLAEYAESFESENEENVYDKGYSTELRWGAVLRNFKETVA